MATILEQEALEPKLNEGEEFGDLSELVAAPNAEAASSEPSDNIEKSITGDDIPQKFKGKELKDVIRSYEELEKAYGRRNNEYGELRKLSDEIIRSGLQFNNGGNPAASEERKKVEITDIFDNPDKVLHDTVATHPKIQQLEQELIKTRRDEARKRFESTHPDYVDVIGSQNFQGWLSSNPTIHRLFAEADKNYDYAAGSDIIGLYKQMNAAKVDEAKSIQQANRDKALKAASVEKGSTGQSSKRIYKQSDLMKMMIRDPQAYQDPTFQAELMRAYEEDRVR